MQAPLGAAELHRVGSCCWRCLFPTSLMIRVHFPVLPDQQIWARSHAPCVSSRCKQWGLQTPLGAAELHREGSCCWRCLFPTSLMIRGQSREKICLDKSATNECGKKRWIPFLLVTKSSPPSGGLRKNVGLDGTLSVSY